MRRFLMILISLFYFSCEKSNQIIISDNIKTFSQFPKEEILELNNLIEYKLGNPRQMIMIDSTLILGNYASGQEYFLHNYSLNKHEFSKPYISKGRGFKQVMGLINIGVNDKYLWLNDFTAKKMMLIDKDKVFKDSSYFGIKEYSFNESRYFRSILLDDLRCITTGSETSKYKIQIIDLPTGEVYEEFGSLEKWSKEIPLHIVAKASLTQTFLKPTKDKIVLAYIHTDIIEIFDLNTKKSISLQGPEKFDLDFKIYNNVWFENEKTRTAFIGGTVTNKYIYLLYSGKKFTNENAYKGNYIFIYDWNMNPIKKIKLNNEVYEICISDDDKTLYSYNEETGYIVSANIN